MNRMVWRFHLGCGEIELHGFRIAMDESQDPMPARVHARDQVRPGNWTLRRNTGRELAERPLLREFGKVGHLAFRHELPQQLRIHSIDAENDQLLPTASILITMTRE